MKVENIFVEIGFMRYSGVTLYCDSIYRYNPQKHNLVVSDSYRWELQTDIKRYLNDTFVPNPGDEIHVVPVCPITTQDLRNNYKIKRNLDEGVCNVFYDLKTFSLRRIYKSFLFNEEHKILITSNKNTGYTSLSDRLDNCTGSIPDEYKNLTFKFHEEELELLFYYASESYVKLLNGKCTKPCIHYSKLKMKRNELTLDMLNMVYGAGIKISHTEDNVNNAILTLTALSQCNWKKYPKTIELLFDVMKNRASVFRYLHNRPNQQPKAIQELLTKTYEDAESCENDEKLRQEFANSILGISETKFVSFDDMTDRLLKVGMTTYQLNKVYDLTVRISPKKYEESRS